MTKKSFLLPITLLISCYACSQPKAETDCKMRIDHLYATYKIHLIYCSYYFDKANELSNAYNILNDLRFYRDTINLKIIKRKDNKIISNLKRNVCKQDTNVISQIGRWCEISEKIGRIRTKEDFTLEGYMEFLNSNNLTKGAVTPFLKEDRTIYSLSSNELEEVYFRSIGIISLLTPETEANLLERLKNWNFK